MNDFNNYVGLLTCPTFWTLAIGSIEYLMWETKREKNLNKVRFDDLDFTSIDDYIDEVVDIKNNDTYLDIINDTVSPWYRLQFTFTRSRKHSRRKILSTIRDVVIGVVKSYLIDNKRSITGQACIPSEIGSTKLDKEFTLDYIVELAYVKLLNELVIPESNHEGIVKNILSKYILCVCTSSILKFGCDNFNEWVAQHNL